MNTNALTRRYDVLTPGERYCLMHAANGRDDEVEHERLIRAAKPIALSMPDYAPHAHALEEIALLILLELLDDAARYLEMYDRAGDTFEEIGITAAEPHWQRALEVAYGCGYVFRAKVEGWKLFCQEWQLDPFLLWQELPGFERMQRAIALSEHAAFQADGMLDWLNRRRKRDDPLLESMPLTPSHYAADLQQTYQMRTDYWGGK